MKLPNADKAYIPPRKLLDYLLSLSHPVGGSKARFFRSAGFDDTNVSTLEHGLLEIARSGEVMEVEQTTHGTKYAVEGVLQTPARGPKSIQTL
jgi:hypothetical protein